MAAPSWLAASTGSRTLPGQVNQFLGVHSSTWVYAGVQRAAQATGTALYASTAGAYLAQTFTTAAGQTTVGQVWLQISTVGGSPTTATITPLTVGLYATLAGAPTGSALASTAVHEQYVYTSPFWVPVPLCATGLAAGATYALVVSAAGSGSAYYVWQHSNQPSGASTSPDGTTWTAQAYGLMFQVFDQTPGGQVQFLYDDDGARWAQFTYDSVGRVSALTEYCTAQNASAPLTSTRTLTYASGMLTGVA